MPNLLRRACEKALLIGRQTCRGGRLAVHRRQATRILRDRSPPFRLHLGCGSNYLPGWINIDANRLLPQVDMQWNLDDGLPFPDESCTLAYSEHVLEHFSAERGGAILRECRRVLAPIGTLRIAMPSLEHLVAKYLSRDWRDQEWLRAPERQFIKTPAEMLNVAFRWWGHAWLYDREELHRRLLEAGFTTIVDVEWGQSDDDDLRGLETRPDSRLICEARSRRSAVDNP